MPHFVFSEQGLQYLHITPKLVSHLKRIKSISCILQQEFAEFMPKHLRCVGRYCDQPSKFHKNPYKF